MIFGSQRVAGTDVPVFQLLQWKHAIRLEGVGLRHSSGRSVSAHAKQKLGLPPRMKREDVIAHINRLLEGSHASNPEPVR